VDNTEPVASGYQYQAFRMPGLEKVTSLRRRTTVPLRSLSIPDWAFSYPKCHSQEVLILVFLLIHLASGSYHGGSYYA
jgi:hypothetical protein